MRFLLENPCAGLLLKPGLRKTSITLGAIKILRREELVRRVLVIAPVRVAYSVWPDEIKKWTDFNGMRAVVLHGLKKDQLLEEDADIYMINPEGLAWLLGEQKIKTMRRKGRKIEYDEELVGQEGVSVKTEFVYDLGAFYAMGFDLLVVDEASKFRKSDTQRFHALKQVLPSFSRRIVLTGSPTPRGLLDLFGIMYLIDLGYSLGPYITHYRRAYFMPAGFGGFTWLPQLGAKDLIYERISPFIFSLDDKAYVQMPELVEVPVYIDLPPKARKLYDEVEKEFFALLEDGTPIVAANAGVATIKCRQVAAGGIYLQQMVDEKGRKVGQREWKHVHDEKTIATRDIVDEMMGEQVLIAYDFEHDLSRLLEEFGKDSAVIGSGVSPAKSKAIIDKWNRGELPYIFGHPASMAHGLNAQEGNAHNVVIHSPNPDFELYDQFIRRLLRSGNTASHVFVHVLIAKNTIDEVTWALLREKDVNQRDLMAAMDEYSKRRRGKSINVRSGPGKSKDWQARAGAKARSKRL